MSKSVWLKVVVPTGVVVSNVIIIKLDTGSYSAGTPMSANDLAFFQPLLNMNTEQALKHLGNKLYFRLDNNRNEVHTTSYFSIRNLINETHKYKRPPFLYGSPFAFE